MLNGEYIKQKLTIDNVIFILKELGADYNYINDKEIHFKSICHTSDSYKLYYYISNMNFYCHRDGESWDIFSLYAKIKNINYYQAIKCISKLLNIKNNNNELDNWQGIKKFLDNSEDNKALNLWDKKILNNFSDKYYSGWINEGISPISMDKYSIKWCNRNASIIIPCFDIDNNLIGIRQRYLRNSDIKNGKYKPYISLDGTNYKFPVGLNLYGINHNMKHIKEVKKCVLVESEKSVLQSDTFFNKNNITLGLYGSNVSKEQRDIILSLGIDELVIGLDFDYIDIYDENFKLYRKKIIKIKKIFDSYCKVSVLCSLNKHNIKDSPTDNGKDFFLDLYKKRIKLN